MPPISWLARLSANWREAQRRTWEPLLGPTWTKRRAKYLRDTARWAYPCLFLAVAALLTNMLTTTNLANGSLGEVISLTFLLAVVIPIAPMLWLSYRFVAQIRAELRSAGHPTDLFLDPRSPAWMRSWCMRNRLTAEDFERAAQLAGGGAGE